MCGTTLLASDASGTMSDQAKTWDFALICPPPSEYAYDYFLVGTTKSRRLAKTRVS